MGLINLIKRLPNGVKSRILSSEATKIIRYSFVNSDDDALPSDILNEAVALHAGIMLVNKSRNRELLIEYIDEEDLQSLGFGENSTNIFDEAIKFYKKNVNQFMEDFHIEEEYRRIEVEDSRKSWEYVTPIYGKCNGTLAFPHPYQLRLKKDLTSHLMAPVNYDTNKSLLTMPTGSGKTVLAMETIVDLFRLHYAKTPLNICWLVNSVELAEQSLESFQKLWKQKGDRMIMAQRYFNRFNKLNEEKVSKITFATFQLLTKRLIRREKEDINYISNVDYLFIDEAHFTGAEEYRKIFKFYKDNNDNAKIIGLTATPLRSEDDDFSSLRGMFNHYLRLKDESYKEVDSPIEYLQKGKYLSILNFHVLNQAIENKKSKKDDMSGYYKDLHESVKNACENVIEKKQNTIIFAESKSHAIALSLYLRSKRIENKLIIGETPMANRKEYIEQLGDKDHDLCVLVNERILSTGIDVPGLNSIMVLSEIDSITSCLQILGRAMRGPKNGGNKINTVYLTKDNKNKLENFKILEGEAINN